MDTSGIDMDRVVNLLLLLLIGMGPKVALVPFLEKTRHFDPQRQRAIGRQMVTMAIITAVVLFVLGKLLLRFLHITPGAVAIGGAIILAILAINMVSRAAGEVTQEEAGPPEDLTQIAVYPLAIPYLLNPVGITVLFVASSEVFSIASAGIVLLLILLVGAFDYLVFANIDKLSSRLNPVSLVISEVVFGILMVAIAVQMVVYGLEKLGIIAAVGH